jgi:hypothetical protein
LQGGEEKGLKTVMEMTEIFHMHIYKYHNETPFVQLIYINKKKDLTHLFHESRDQQGM